MQVSWQIFLASCSSVKAFLELGLGDVEHQLFWTLLSRAISYEVLPRKYRKSTKSVFLKSCLGILSFAYFSFSPGYLQQTPITSRILLWLSNPDSQAQLTHHLCQDKAQYNHVSHSFKGWLLLLSAPAHPPQNSVSIQDNLIWEKPHKVSCSSFWSKQSQL